MGLGDADLGGTGPELEETRLALGRSSLVFELLDFPPLGFSLLLEPPDPHRVLGRAHVPVSHTRHRSLPLVRLIERNIKPEAAELELREFAERGETVNAG